MVKWGNVASTAFDAFEKANSTVAFYMFIIEESIQTVSMAVYLSNKAGNTEKMKELAQWNKTELVEPLKDFCDGAGYVGFPMNLAFKKFAEASEKAMDYYISLVEEKPPAPTTGSIYIGSSPRDAVIYLDGEDTGTLTPQLISDLSPGEHTILLKKEGYNDYEATETITAGETLEKYYIMEKIPVTTGNIHIKSSPSEAEIFIDGHDTEKLTPEVITDLSPGEHTILLKKEGYNDYEATETITAGETLEKYYIMEEKAPTTGNIYIKSDPTGARIFIDGEDTGKLTPETIKDLSLGEHEIKLTLPGYVDYVTTETTVPGETLERLYVLEKE